MSSWEKDLEEVQKQIRLTEKFYSSLKEKRIELSKSSIRSQMIDEKIMSLNREISQSLNVGERLLRLKNQIRRRIDRDEKTKEKK